MTASAKDPDIIYLSPSCSKGDCITERQWCEENVWNDCPECGAKAVRYIKADTLQKDVEEIAEQVRRI